MAERASDVSGRPLRSDAQSNRAALLEAALELVSEGGYETLTVAAVARRAGLNRSTAYQHFEDREQILRAVGKAFATELREVFAEPREFGEQISFFVDYFSAHPDIARIWMFQLLTGQSRNAPGWGDYVAALERLARSRRSQDGIDAEMLGIIGMTSAMVWSLMSGQRTDDPDERRAGTARFARELKRLFLFGALRPEQWPELSAEFDPDPS